MGRIQWKGIFLIDLLAKHASSMIDGKAPRDRILPYIAAYFAYRNAGGEEPSVGFDDLVSSLGERLRVEY